MLLLPMKTPSKMAQELGALTKKDLIVIYTFLSSTREMKYLC